MRFDLKHGDVARQHDDSGYRDVSIFSVRRTDNRAEDCFIAFNCYFSPLVFGLAFFQSPLVSSIVIFTGVYRKQMVATIFVNLFSCLCNCMCGCIWGVELC